MAKRVLLAGLYHETNTFLRGRSALADFQVRRGPEVLRSPGDSSPLAAVCRVAAEKDWDLRPALDCRGAPGPIAADEVVESFWRELSATAGDELARSVGTSGRPDDAARGLDGVFLVMHGAMVSETFDDVEGEVLARLRALPGAADVPLGGVLDLHANFTRRMARHADALVAYRENPHTDANAAARGAAMMLDRIMDSGRRPRTFFRHPSLLWPPTGTATGEDPMKALEEMAREAEREEPGLLAVNVWAGFAFADMPEAGVSFSAVSDGADAVAEAVLERLERRAWELRSAGCVGVVPVETAMEHLRSHRKGPVLLVEPSDNIGAGAPGDGTGVLRALLEYGIENACVVINDPQAVDSLRTQPPGSRKTLPVGGRGSELDPGPVTLAVELLAVGDGRFTLEDPHSHLASMCGSRIDMGPCAAVRSGGVTILLTSRATPPFDLGQLRSNGIEPESLFAIGVKAAVAHRGAYGPIAVASYTVDTPGPCRENLRSLPYRKVARPAYPLDDPEAGGRPMAAGGQVGN